MIVGEVVHICEFLQNCVIDSSIVSYLLREIFILYAQLSLLSLLLISNWNWENFNLNLPPPP